MANQATTKLAPGTRWLSPNNVQGPNGNHQKEMAGIIGIANGSTPQAQSVLNGSHKGSKY